MTTPPGAEARRRGGRCRHVRGDGAPRRAYPGQWDDAPTAGRADATFFRAGFTGAGFAPRPAIGLSTAEADNIRGRAGQDVRAAHVGPRHGPDQLQPSVDPLAGRSRTQSGRRMRTAHLAALWRWWPAHPMRHRP